MQGGSVTRKQQCGTGGQQKRAFLPPNTDWPCFTRKAMGYGKTSQKLTVGIARRQNKILIWRKPNLEECILSVWVCHRITKKHSVGSRKVRNRDLMWQRFASVTCMTSGLV